jgi:hypothetical protein
MNFTQLMTKLLTDEGLTESEAEAVVLFAIRHPEFCSDMDGHWNKKIADYPQAMCVSIRNALWPFTFKWLQRSHPEAWYLVHFTPEYNKLEGKELDAFMNAFAQKQQETYGVEVES